MELAELSENPINERRGEIVVIEGNKPNMGVFVGVDREGKYWVEYMEKQSGKTYSKGYLGDAYPKILEAYEIEFRERSGVYWNYYEEESFHDSVEFVQEESLWGNVTNLTNNIMNSLKQVPKTLKRVLSDDLQKQYKAGIIDGNLEITDKGKRELWMSLQDKFSDELTESAEEIISELEDNQ